MSNRTFYAVQAVQLAPAADTLSNPTYENVSAIQSVGVNTNFNLEPVYQLVRYLLSEGAGAGVACLAPVRSECVTLVAGP